MPRTIKRGDTYPPLTGSVSDASGPVSLAAATAVRLIVKPTAGGSTQTFTVSHGSPTTASWSYNIADGDFDVVGDFSAEIEVEWGPGSVQTFPNEGYEIIHVTQDLGGVG